MGKRTVKILILVLTAWMVFFGTARVAGADRKSVDAVISSIPPDWPTPGEVHCKAAILMDATSGEILYALRATDPMYPASTTKLMTALLALENASLADEVTFSSRAVAIPSGSSHIGMRRGEKMVMRECLISLLLPSANEVANAIAEHVAGDQKTFVARMNDRMALLGGVNTVFKNTNGLQDEEHYTCAYDLALIMKELVGNSTFVDIASMQSYVHHADILLPKTIPMTNTNMMIRPSSEYYNENVVLGKTGHTAEAGYNLVIYAEKDGTKLISVVMGAESGYQYISTESLLNYGFHSFRQVLPAELDDSLNIENRFTSSGLSIPTPEVSLLHLNAGETILLPETVTFDTLEKQVTRDTTGIYITYLYRGYPLGNVALSYAGREKLPDIFTEKDASVRPKEKPELKMADGWLLLVLLGLAVLTGLLVWYLIRRFKPRKTFRS